MAANHAEDRTTKILVLNPNSSNSMTDGMKTAVDDLQLPASTSIQYYTAPETAPASINDAVDLTSSTVEVLADLDINPSTLERVDGVLIACFSVHPLVPSLQYEHSSRTKITGIFEASISVALSLTRKYQRWGIVTTGKFWEQHLTDGVKKYLGAEVTDANSKFGGVESTGLDASDFHDGVDPTMVKQKLKDATKRLFAKDVRCVVMGCAGMAGLEDTIREAAAEMDDEELVKALTIVNGVKAGVLQVHQMIKLQ